MLLLPSYIGVGFLGLPYMVKLLGLWGGSGGLLFYGVIAALGALILTGCTQRLEERTGEKAGNIGNVLEISMTVGPPCVQHHARKMRLCIDCCMCLTSGLYLPDLISLMNIFAKDVLHPYIDTSNTLSIVIICVLLLPVYLTRRVRLLSFIATAGNTVLFGIFIISFQYIFQDLPDISTRSPIKSVDYLTITTFTNDVIFSYCGIILVLPVRNRMKNKQTFDGCNGVLGIVLVMVTTVHVGCGFFGYLKFGEMTHVNYLMNLPGDNWIYNSLKILAFLTMYCINGTAVLVVIDIIWPLLKERFSMELVQNYGEYICRVILLLLACTFTVLVPEFELLMSLTGWFGVMLTTLIPYIIMMLTMYGEVEPTLSIDKVKRKLLFVICTLMLMFGTYLTVAGIGATLYMTLFHIVI